MSMSDHSIRGSTKLVGVLGDPVAHSLSPAMHNAAFQALGLDWCYVPLHVAPERMEAALPGLVALGFVGANVTIPHKERAAELSAELSPTARAVGAVNTLIVRNGALYGDNTDVGGILRALAEAGVDLPGRAAVVLGAGGSARAAAYALAGAGCRVTVANRHAARAESLAALLTAQLGREVEAIALGDEVALQARLEGTAVLVNTTAAGMEPHADESPLPERVALHPGLAVLDLVYAPRQTLLLRRAAAAGCRTIEGLRVLIHQGALSFEMWTGQPAPVDVMSRAIGG